MLDPNQRSLYTDALRPPPGMVFDQGIATTYSLDLNALLTVPLHLALFSGGRTTDLLKDGVAVLEALRRTSARLSIYCQQGQIHVPEVDRVLYGMLEPIVHEVRAPGGGAFHAKLWLLRFVNAEEEGNPCLRALVLSRNLTYDRSWDISLLLEGRLKRGAQRGNRGLVKLVRTLPKLAVHQPPQEVRARAELLADEASRARWELPEGFDHVSFHANGLGGRRWWPKASSQLAVISPFCDDQGLRELVRTTGSPIALVSRPETLDALKEETLDHFERCLVLEEAAETEDGEDTEGLASRLRGLHAKVYVGKHGWDTRIALGSANATRPGLLTGENVEIVAELVGKASRVGRVDELLDPEGLGEVLVDYERPDELPQPDPEALEAERALKEGRRALAEAGLVLYCRGEDDLWRLELVSSARIRLEGIAGLQAWPISVSDAHATNIEAIAGGDRVPLGACALASVTGLIAFELTAAAKREHVRFVLNLPIEGLPEGRDAAVMRTIISNQEGFLRYLALLLGDLGEDLWPSAFQPGRGGAWELVTGAGTENPAILEHLVRALAREPERLHDVRRIVEQLQADEKSATVVPQEFLVLWRSFEQALKEAP